MMKLLALSTLSRVKTNLRSCNLLFCVLIRALCSSGLLMQGGKKIRRMKRREEKRENIKNKKKERYKRRSVVSIPIDT